MEPRLGGQAATSHEEEQLLQALTLIDLHTRLRERRAAKRIPQRRVM